MFMVSRDGSEDLYAHGSSYTMDGDDLVFYAEGREVGRVVGFSQTEGNSVVEVDADDSEDESADDESAEVEAALETLEDYFASHGGGRLALEMLRTAFEAE